MKMGKEGGIPVLSVTAVAFVSCSGKKFGSQKREKKIAREINK